MRFKVGQLNDSVRIISETLIFDNTDANSRNFFDLNVC